MSPTTLARFAQIERATRNLHFQVAREFGNPERALYPRDYYRPADRPLSGWPVDRLA